MGVGESIKKNYMNGRKITSKQDVIFKAQAKNIKTILSLKMINHILKYKMFFHMEKKVELMKGKTKMNKIEEYVPFEILFIKFFHRR